MDEGTGSCTDAEKLSSFSMYSTFNNHFKLSKCIP